MSILSSLGQLDVNTGVYEYIRVKCFLYKYNPPFTQGEDTTLGLASIATYKIPLEEQYFSKYDISNYFAGYSFEQDIHGNTFDWSLTLQDHICTPSDFVQVLNADVANQPILNNDVNLPVTTAPTNDVPGASDGLVNLANYEVNTETPYEDSHKIDPASIVEAAKLERGNAPPELADKLAVDNALTATSSVLVEGIRLSDLIQKYDMVSLFLYKETYPLESVNVVSRDEVVIKKDDGTTILLPQVTVNLPVGIGELISTGSVLSAQDLQQETILMSKYVGSSKTIFSNEFNGFVMTKTFTRDVSGVDQVTLSGNGVTRLLGATRRNIKASLLQGAIYGPLTDQSLPGISAFQTVYAGSPLVGIIEDLFSLTYSMSFDDTPSDDGTTIKAVSDDYFNISALQIQNVLQACLFTVPPYLLSLVMKRRGFNFWQLPTASVQSMAQEAVSAVSSISSSSSTSTTGPNQFQSLDTFLDNNVNTQFSNDFDTGKSPVVFDPVVLQMQTYFRFLASILEDFNPKLSTGYEILDDIKKITMAEIFETPTGVVQVRNPQYNSVTNLHWSSDLNISTRSYTETANDLVAMMKMSYAVSGLGQVDPTNEFAFIDGKLLAQFGFLESSVDANPNANNDKDQNNTNNLNQPSILIRYAEFFLRYHNASLNTGTIVADLDNTVNIGDTFFHEDDNKFGYIVGISKNITPGTPATMTLSLSFVRDAYDATPGQGIASNIQFSILPTLIYIEGDPNADVPQSITTSTTTGNTTPTA